MQAAVDVEKPADPIETTEDCRYCWMCRQACPVGHVTARETLTPHGWALTIASVKRGAIAWNDETVDVLYSCADCGLCRAHCITDRPLPDAIAATRAQLVATGKAPAIVRELEERLKRFGSLYAGPADETAASKVAAARALEARADVVIRQTISDARGASTGGSASTSGGVGSGGASASHGASISGGASVGGVGLFVSDVGRRLGSREVDAVVRLLGAVGIAPVLVGEGWSNGVVASSLGLVDTAVALGRRVVADVEASGCRQLLVLTPEDRYAFEGLYRDRLGVVWPAGVAIREVTSVLGEALAAGRLVFRPRANATPTYAYHDPCHTARVDRDDAAPRALLAAALGGGSARQPFWRERRAHPCGATGGLQFTQPGIAASLADARLADTRAAGASWLITDDPACAHHLRSRPQQDVTIVGFYELLADQLVS
jgi:Fe-S oxidoreductase